MFEFLFKYPLAIFEKGKFVLLSGWPIWLLLLLIAAAAYCAVRSVRSTRCLLLIPVILLVANATKYASVLFDPVVVGLAVAVRETLLAMGNL